MAMALEAYIKDESFEQQAQTNGSESQGRVSCPCDFCFFTKRV
jgi:hypothetical protein